ncbi:MAG: SIS domain-containing protein [Eubacteriales bacterium]|nr:SIS domain-containing protein [Eubacteriales bacterium]
MDAKQMMATYENELMEAIKAIDPEQFGKALAILLQAYKEDRQVFVFGNGGSAGTANHFVCDFGKNAVEGNRRRFRILSLSDNVEKITALGNDIAYEEIFRQQMINLMRSGDVAIAISASGNSPNVVRACEYAHEMGVKLIVLAGFSGGKIAPMGDAALVANMQSYERIEDIHLIILHMIVCFFKENQALLA